MGTSKARLSAALVALATVMSGLVLSLGATPAQAEWSEPGTLVRFKICKQVRHGSKGWVFLARAQKRPSSDDARAGMAIYVGGDRRQRWGSGWLHGREIDRGWVRTRKTAKVTVQVWQEAGDRDGAVGTSRELRVLRANQVARCD